MANLLINYPALEVVEELPEVPVIEIEETREEKSKYHSEKLNCRSTLIGQLILPVYINIKIFTFFSVP